ncbi:hypothetical protein KC973_02790 [Candidatus Saccharibacteria bacterium]|nr:hypothetical protein [Candidatus Saccharibacteria bacterium]
MNFESGSTTTLDQEQAEAEAAAELEQQLEGDASPVEADGTVSKPKLLQWAHKLKEKVFAGDTAAEDVPLDAEAQQAVAAIEQEAEAVAREMLVKVGQQLGSNEGGWYEDQTSGERLYVKFYENMDQARVEYIANAIYAKLGISAVRSEIIQVDGRDAIAATAIDEPRDMSGAEMHDDPAVRAGFVADAYLANWDVVGLVNDNIVMSSDGPCRVDNGGAMIFRAQGGPKEFPADDIPELTTMLNPSFPAGKVFEGLTEADMAAQAQHLVENLTEADIRTIVEESGATGDVAEGLVQSLVGRRQFLIERFQLDAVGSEPTPETQGPRGRLGAVIEGLGESRANVAELGIRAREVILSDSTHLENQEISFIDCSAEGHINANFKLTEHQSQVVLGELDAISQIEGVEVVHGAKIEYESATGEGSYTLCEAVEIHYNGLVIRLATAEKDEGSWSGKSIIQAARGLVEIEIPYQEGEDAQSQEEIEERISDVMTNILGVTEGLSVPTQEAEQQYKDQRNRWHHKLPFGPVRPEDAERAARLVRQEVYPGYHTMVEVGRSAEYEAQYGEFALMHTASSPDRIVRLLQAGGLMSSHERFRRGLLVTGMSTAEDFGTGGADSVFVRTVVEGSGNAPYKRVPGPTIVMGPRLYDRTDWYAYEEDSYGSVRPEKWDRRQSPEELLQRQSEGRFSAGNEQMFRTGIPSEEFVAIACPPIDSFSAQQLGYSLGLSTSEARELWTNEGSEAIAQRCEQQGITEI